MAFVTSSAPRMGLEVTIRTQGKIQKSGSESFLETGFEEYMKRLRPVLALDVVFHKSDADLVKGTMKDKERGAALVLLDERGKQMESPAFSEALYKNLELGGSRLTFVIGGAEGLPPELKNKPREFEYLSLSKMVLTHTWARALLAEQIYRAVEIQKGTGYHKE